MIQKNMNIHASLIMKIMNVNNNYKYAIGDDF